MATIYKRNGRGPYVAAWYDHTGKRRTRTTKTTDKATAQRIARKHEAEAALRRDGVIDPTLDGISKEAARTIQAHLSDYESKLRAANRTEKHIKSTTRFIRWIAEHAGFRTAADITADGVNLYAGKLRDEDRSARTIQAHLNAIKAFTKWLTDHHKLPRDPLSSVKKPNPKTDRRHERRMLLPQEWRLLESATKAGPERYGITGAERCLLYRTAIQTGLRANELRSLTRGRLYFDSKPPCITCKAGSTKNQQEARQYIPQDLADDLKAHVSVKAPRAPIFRMPHETNVARMLRDDMAAARKAWISEARDDPQEYAQRQQSDFLADTNHEGESLDFHSLRHTYGAWLAMAGEHPKTIQTVMRHSAITLTMDTYGHLFPGQESAAVGRLQSIMADQPETERHTLRATGTDHHTAEKALRICQQSGRERVPVGAKPCDGKNQGRHPQETPQPLQIAGLSDGLPVVATGCESSSGGIRTPDTRIMIPLL